jgi:hypothetical protein
MQIVITWVNMDGVELTGKYLDRYYTEPEIKRTAKAHGCMWLNDGDTSDVLKAEAYAKSEDGHRVFTFTGEKDPLGKAKAIALAEFMAKVS